MSKLNGIPAVRMAALVFARNGRTKAHLVDFVQQHVNVSARQISRQIRELAISEDDAGRLCLPTNVLSLWREVSAVRKEPEIASGSAA
jgi:hypothetical protein